jgi:hypothetical protein
MKFVNTVLFLFTAVAMAAPNPAPNGEVLVSLAPDQRLPWSRLCMWNKLAD